MADFFDYLDWYGDFDFSTVPFNEVDNIVLSQLAYLKLDGVFGPDEVLSVSEAQRRFLAIHGMEAEISTDELKPKDEKLPDNGPLIDSRVNILLGRLAEAGRRFGDARIGFYESVLSEESREQFAALSVMLSDGSTYVAFRGTDDSIVGWIEDCEMSYKIVPAQHDALAYLRRVAHATIGPLRVGGHSKGGNLAAYAAVAATELDSRIEEVWCNDSPGFEEEVVPLKSFKRLDDRMRIFTPEYSLVGSLMDHPIEPEIIESGGHGVSAHSLIQWHVMRTTILPGKELHPGSVEVGYAFQQLLESYDIEGRELLVHDLWRICQENDINSIAVFKQGGSRVKQLFDSIDTITEDNRRALQDFLMALTGGAIKGEWEESLAKTSQALAPVAQAVGSALAEAERRSRELFEAARPHELPKGVDLPEEAPEDIDSLEAIDPIPIELETVDGMTDATIPMRTNI